MLFPVIQQMPSAVGTMSSRSVKLNVGDCNFDIIRSVIEVDLETFAKQMVFWQCSIMKGRATVEKQTHYATFQFFVMFRGVG
jgi:hypothetical protein